MVEERYRGGASANRVSDSSGTRNIILYDILKELKRLNGYIDELTNPRERKKRMLISLMEEIDAWVKVWDEQESYEFTVVGNESKIYDDCGESMCFDKTLKFSHVKGNEIDFVIKICYNKECNKEEVCSYGSSIKVVDRRLGCKEGIIKSIMSDMVEMCPFLEGIEVDW